MKEKYGSPFFFSVLLHTTVLVLVVFSIAFTPKSTVWTDKTKADQDIIQAVTVNQAQVEAQVEQIKAAQLQKAQQEQERLNAIAQQTAAMKRQQAAAAQAAKNNLAKLQQQQALAQKKLMDLQKQQVLAQQQAQKAQEQAKQLQAQKAQQLKQQQQLAAQAKQEQLEKQFQQQVAAEQEKLAAARNQQIQSQLDHYKALIINSIGQQWIVPANTNPSLTCQLDIRLAPGGAVLGVKVSRSSGNPALDQSAVTAVYKASPLPVPQDPVLFNQFRELNLTVKPEQVAAQ